MTYVSHPPPRHPRPLNSKKNNKMGYEALRYFGVSHAAASAFEVVRVLLIMGILYSTLTRNNAEASPLGMHQEFVHCVERGACRFELICPFTLEADPSRCFLETCRPLHGHLMAVHNALEYTVNVTWSVVGNATHGGRIEVAGATTRYFDTQLAVNATHSVGLAVDGQTVAVVLLPPDAATACTPDETCDYLLRACYGVQEGQQGATKCVEYARHCHGFAKVDEERRQACIPACLDTYYGHFFQDESPFVAYDSDLLVAILLELKARGVDLSDGSKTQLGAEGFVDGTLEGAGFDLCALTQCHSSNGGPPTQTEVCHNMTSGLIIISVVFALLVAILCWFVVRRCRAAYRHGGTFAAI